MENEDISGVPVYEKGDAFKLRAGSFKIPRSYGLNTGVRRACSDEMEFEADGMFETLSNDLKSFASGILVNANLLSRGREAQLEKSIEFFDRLWIYTL